jgi:hypothetical protein
MNSAAFTNNQWNIYGKTPPPSFRRISGIGRRKGWSKRDRAIFPSQELSMFLHQPDAPDHLPPSFTV